MLAQDPAVFIGSSSEGKPFAEYLQAALEDYCEAAVWDQGAFGLSESGLEALLAEAQRVDFAILVLTPDDLTVRRGKTRPSARDNVIFEAGLFAGALGSRRTFLVHAKDVDLDLPSDLAGITTCAFKEDRSDSNVRAAINPAALKVREAMSKLGLRSSGRSMGSESAASGVGRRSLDEERTELSRELDALSTAAEAQGWSVKTRTDSVFRLLSRDGTRYSFSLGAPYETRVALRKLAQELNEAGLRLNRTLSLPVDAVPPTPAERIKERPKRAKAAPRKRRARPTSN